MYFPDLKSVASCAQEMAKQPDPDKRYVGIVPVTEDELPRARKELGAYMRNTWGDKIAALEIELALTEETYNSGLQGALRRGEF
jgi:hypothetical protein